LLSPSATRKVDAEAKPKNIENGLSLAHLPQYMYLSDGFELGAANLNFFVAHHENAWHRDFETNFRDLVCIGKTKSTLLHIKRQKA